MTSETISFVKGQDCLALLHELTKCCRKKIHLTSKWETWASSAIKTRLTRARSHGLPHKMPAITITINHLLQGALLNHLSLNLSRPVRPKSRREVWLIKSISYKLKKLIINLSLTCKEKILNNRSNDYFSKLKCKAGNSHQQWWFLGRFDLLKKDQASNHQWGEHHSNNLDRNQQCPRSQSLLDWTETSINCNSCSNSTSFYSSSKI